MYVMECMLYIVAVWNWLSLFSTCFMALIQPWSVTAFVCVLSRHTMP